jgi:hypothetical protein
MCRGILEQLYICAHTAVYILQSASEWRGARGVCNFGEVCVLPIRSSVGIISHGAPSDRRSHTTCTHPKADLGNVSRLRLFISLFGGWEQRANMNAGKAFPQPLISPKSRPFHVCRMCAALAATRAYLLLVQSGLRCGSGAQRRRGQPCTRGPLRVAYVLNHPNLASRLEIVIARNLIAYVSIISRYAYGCSTRNWRDALGADRQIDRMAASGTRRSGFTSSQRLP